MRHQPRKRFGQNFLVDHRIINQIISTISPKNDDSIIEIGPGKGAITFPIREYLDHQGNWKPSVQYFLSFIISST